MSRVGYLKVEDGDDDFGGSTPSLAQLFFSLQRRSRLGKQTALLAKNDTSKTLVVKKSVAYSAGPLPSPASHLERCGDVESTPIGLVRALVEPPNGFRKRLCRAVDEKPDKAEEISDGYKREGFHTMSIERPSWGATIASNGITSLSPFPEKSGDLRHDFESDVRNNTATSESKGVPYVHTYIGKGEIWDEEFSAFANRKNVASSTTTQPGVTAAMNALKVAASKGQLLHVEKIPARPAAYTNQQFNLQTKLQKALQERGVKRFYTHQAAALRRVFNGSSIVAATPTASGKSMTYIIPVLNSLIRDSNSRAFLIFPFKALARDQLKILSDLLAEVKKGSHCFGYDGDTDDDQKSYIRNTGKIILTTPDMLHLGILPHHKLWIKFFTNLKFVVVDEAHTYRGIFGSHVGCVLRRLLRIARYYGSEPRFICCSATMANPKEHVKKLTTIDMEVINGSGSPAGEKYVLCWLPPETKNGDRRSIYKETVKIVVALMKAELQILVFVEARKSSEILCKMICQKLTELKLIDLVEKVDSYRAGYTQEERMSLEKRLQDGQLRALVTTRALEVGIDVGNLDATVHMGVPDTMCSLWQQVEPYRSKLLGMACWNQSSKQIYEESNRPALFLLSPLVLKDPFDDRRNSRVSLVRFQGPYGSAVGTSTYLLALAGRAGRRQEASMAVIIGQERAPDIFYMKNPQKLFSRDVEQAVCHPTNPHIMRLQLPCAAQELPLCGNDVQLFGEDYKKIRDELLAEGILQYMTCPRGNDLYGYRYDDYPASEVSIRGISKTKFQLLTGNNVVVEEIDEKMALRMLYKGAIYRRARDTYRIRHLDVHKKQAFGELYGLHHMTEVIMKTKVLILNTIVSRATLGTHVHLGQLEVVEHVAGYTEYDVMKNKPISTVALNYPPSVLKTVGLWWDLPAEVMQKLTHMAYEALLVLRRVVLPLLAAMTMSDAADMLGLEILAHEQTEQPEIFFYDAIDGGIGIAEQAYKGVEYAWRQALNILQRCDCKFGCPACTRSASHNVNSEANSSKHAAILLLEFLLGIRKLASTHAPSHCTTIANLVEKPPAN